MSLQSRDIPSITLNGSPLPAEHVHKASTSPEKPVSSRSNTRTAPSYDFTYERSDYNLIVYNYKGDGVIVQAAPTYEEAIDIAIREFPRLKDVPREDITICYETASNGKIVYWRISESAWNNSARKFHPRTKLQIAVRGEDRMAGQSAKPPPYEASVNGSCAREARTRSGCLKGCRPPLVLVNKTSGTSISSFFRRL